MKPIAKTIHCITLLYTQMQTLSEIKIKGMMHMFTLSQTIFRVIVPQTTGYIYVC